MNSLCKDTAARICEYAPILGLVSKYFPRNHPIYIRDYLTEDGLEWAIENGYKLSCKTFKMLLDAGKMDVIRGIFWYCIPFSTLFHIDAARMGNLEAVQWAWEQRHDLRSMYVFGSGQRRASRNDWVAAVTLAAARNGHVSVTEWGVENGYSQMAPPYGYDKFPKSTRQVLGNALGWRVDAPYLIIDKTLRRKTRRNEIHFTKEYTRDRAVGNIWNGTEYDRDLEFGNNWDETERRGEKKMRFN